MRDNHTAAKTREDELAQYAQYRVEQAGYELLNIAKIMKIMARDQEGDDEVDGNLVDFLGDLVAARADIIIDEGNLRENWAKAQQWK